MAVNEESEDPNEGPGRAAVVSTILLVLIYVIVSAGAQAFHGTGLLSDEENASDVLNALGQGVLGSGRDKLPDHRRAHLRLGLHADDDPADRPHDAVDGPLEGDPLGDRPRPPALSDADRLDAGASGCSRSPSRSR